MSPRARHTPYEDTEVPAGQSQDQIREVLRRHEAEGVQFLEDWGRGRVGFSFAMYRKHPDGSKRPVAVKMDIALAEDPREWLRLKGDERRRTRRNRQVWRALFYYLKSQLEAVEFGLRKFEDAFLADIVAADGRVLGDHVREAIDAGTLRLPERAAVRDE